MIKLFGLNHPFFKPLIRRVLTLVAVGFYGLFELTFGHPGWVAFAAALFAICTYAFFIAFDPEDKGNNDV
ncbi:hypothetical protein ACJ5NV_17310 [Loktanella agnita]|uniref:hypothetical protein n=1 Tax=Loktanella agnita TaxID=287097 RepID=UPI003988D794